MNQQTEISVYEQEIKSHFDLKPWYHSSLISNYVAMLGKCKFDLVRKNISRTNNMDQRIKQLLFQNCSPFKLEDLF